MMTRGGVAASNGSGRGRRVRRPAGGQVGGGHDDGTGAAGRELEVGHGLAPDQGLPETIGADGFDDPNTLAAFVDAVRWGAVTSADPDSYQAPFRSGANVEAYQLEPLRRALQSSRTNLLLADDVGLGKTIEAGLVIQELLLRHRARSVP